MRPISSRTRRRVRTSSATASSSAAICRLCLTRDREPRCRNPGRTPYLRRKATETRGGTRSRFAREVSANHGMSPRPQTRDTNPISAARQRRREGEVRGTRSRFAREVVANRVVSPGPPNPGHKPYFAARDCRAHARGQTGGAFDSEACGFRAPSELIGARADSLREGLVLQFSMMTLRFLRDRVPSHRERRNARLRLEQ